MIFCHGVWFNFPAIHSRMIGVIRKIVTQFSADFSVPEKKNLNLFSRHWSLFCCDVVRWEAWLVHVLLECVRFERNHVLTKRQGSRSDAYWNGYWLLIEMHVKKASCMWVSFQCLAAFSAVAILLGLVSDTAKECSQKCPCQLLRVWANVTFFSLNVYITRLSSYQASRQ